MTPKGISPHRRELQKRIKLTLENIEELETQKRYVVAVLDTGRTLDGSKTSFKDVLQFLGLLCVLRSNIDELYDMLDTLQSGELASVSVSIVDISTN